MNARFDMDLLNGLGPALAKDQLHMAYQPIVSLDDGSLHAVEALVRWPHPIFGNVEPSRFVPLAEHHGLIDALTEWGLRNTLDQWRKWKVQGLDTRIAFNISALSLRHADFPDLVDRECRAFDLLPDRLVLELTEGATISATELGSALTRLRKNGVGLALDDFGVGYSSMMQLRRLPFTEVKIDRFFISDMTISKDSLAIVEATIDLAHRLGITVTAEGIETEEQLRILRKLGCDAGQGYWICKPLEPDALVEWNMDFSNRWKSLHSSSLMSACR